MNREQKAVAIVAAILALITLGLLGGTFYLWHGRAMPKIPRSASSLASPAALDSIPAGSTSAWLYYFDPERDSLVRIPVRFPIESRPENLPQLIRLAWARLQQPAELPGLVSPLPPGSEIESVFIDPKHRTLYLGLNDAYYFNHPGGTIEGWATVYSVVNTLCSLSPMIEKAILLREDRMVRQGPGGWDYSRAFRPDETIVRFPEEVEPGPGDSDPFQ